MQIKKGTRGGDKRRGGNWRFRVPCSIGGDKEKGGTPFMHGGSHMTIDPRIPTMPGRSTLGFHPSRINRMHQARGG